MCASTDQIKLIYTLLDLIYIIFYSLYYINFKRNKRNNFKINKNKKINLYTIHFWKSKKHNSIYHYYPNSKLIKNDYFYASEFPEFYSIGDGLRNSKNNILKSIVKITKPFSKNKFNCWVIKFIKLT